MPTGAPGPLHSEEVRGDRAGKEAAVLRGITVVRLALCNAVMRALRPEDLRVRSWLTVPTG